MGRMGQSMIHGWLNGGLSSGSLQIIDPNIKTTDKFLTENNLKMSSIEEIDLTQGIIAVSYTHLTLPTIYSV